MKSYQSPKAAAGLLPKRIGNLRLRHFCLVELLVTEGSMHKAARAMYITQPAASLMLRELESVYATRLFERSRRGMTPTAAGLALLDRARVLGAEARLIAEQTTGDASTRLICIGALPRVMLDLIPLVADRLRREWPQLRLRFVEGVASQLLPALARGEVDCVVARIPHDLVAAAEAVEFVQQPLYEEGMCIVAGPLSPWSKQRKLSLAGLAEADWILPPPGTEAREVFVNSFLRAGLDQPVARIESTAVITTMTLAERLPYLALAPEAVARKWQREGRLKVLPVPLDQALSPIAYIRRRTQLDSAALHRLGKLIGECAIRLGRRRPALTTG